MKDLLIDCRTALGLAKSMAERERYDTDVYTNRIEMIDKALRKLAVVGRSEQLLAYTEWLKNEGLLNATVSKLIVKKYQSK